MPKSFSDVPANRRKLTAWLMSLKRKGIMEENAETFIETMPKLECHTPKEALRIRMETGYVPPVGMLQVEQTDF